MKNYKLIISLMSGTSLDGVDGLLVKIFNDRSFEFVETHSVDYSDELKEKILIACNNNASTKDICILNFLIGEIFAQCVNELIIKAGVNKSDVDFISSHGQTIFHQPVKELYAGMSVSSTLQIGDISVISQKTGVLTVGDFRTKDMAEDGLGAPLVPFADEIIFGKDIPRIIQNIGGIANSTILSPECETFAFDNGPGNMLIDYFVKKYFNLTYDKNGDIASGGVVDKVWLNELLKENYYKKCPPKTTGRELFNAAYCEKIDLTSPQKAEDKIATLSFLTAKVIYDSYKNFVEPVTKIKEVVIGGGGTYNKFIINSLKSLFEEVNIKTHEDFNINSKFKECLAFAYLGLNTLEHKTNNLPSCTGAKNSVIMGKISY